VSANARDVQPVGASRIKDIIFDRPKSRAVVGINASCVRTDEIMVDLSVRLLTQNVKGSAIALQLLLGIDDAIVGDDVGPGHR